MGLPTVVEARSRLIDLLFPADHQIDGTHAMLIRAALEALEQAAFRAGRLYERCGVDELEEAPAAPVSPEELIAVRRAIEEREQELIARRRGRG